MQENKCAKAWRKNQVKISIKKQKNMNTLVSSMMNKGVIDGGKFEYAEQLGVRSMMNKGMIVVLLWMVQ